MRTKALAWPRCESVAGSSEGCNCIGRALGCDLACGVFCLKYLWSLIAKGKPCKGHCLRCAACHVAALAIKEQRFTVLLTQRPQTLRRSKPFHNRSRSMCEKYFDSKDVIRAYGLMISGQSGSHHQHDKPKLTSVPSHA